MLMECYGMGNPRPCVGDAELIKVVLAARNAKLGNAIKQAHKAKVYTDCQVAIAGITCLEQALVNMLGHQVAKMPCQSCAAGKPDNIYGDDVIWRRLGQFKQQPIPLVVNNLMCVMGSERIPFHIKGVAGPALIMTGPIVIQLAKLPDIASGMDTLSSTVKGE